MYRPTLPGVFAAGVRKGSITWRIYGAGNLHEDNAVQCAFLAGMHGVLMNLLCSILHIVSTCPPPPPYKTTTQLTV